MAAKKSRIDVVKELKERGLVDDLRTGEMRLFRWERNEAKPSEDVVKALAEIYKCTVQAFEGLETLKICFAPYPDSAFLAACGKKGVLEGFGIRNIPELNAITVNVPYPEIPKALKEGKIDVALMNTVDAERKLAQMGEHARSLGPVLKFNGLAILCSQYRGWKSLKSFLIENKNKRATRDARIGDALVACLAQIGNELPTLKLFVPQISAISDVLTALIDGALSKEIASAEKRSIQVLRDAVPSSLKEESQTFKGFLAFLTKTPHKPALFIGGLNQRLQLEDAGAAVLFGNDEFHLVAEVEDDLAEVLHPTNSLIASTKAIEEAPDQIQALSERWNAAVERFSAGERNLRFANALIDAEFEDAKMGLWQAGKRHFERIIMEDLILFKHWKTPSDLLK